MQFHQIQTFLKNTLVKMKLLNYHNILLIICNKKNQIVKIKENLHYLFKIKDNFLHQLINKQKTSMT